MLEIGQLAKDQVYITTSGPKRICKILDVGAIEISEIVTQGKPPEIKSYQSATALVTSPSFPIPGHVDDKEAMLTEGHRRNQKEITGDDLWTEILIDAMREKPSVDNPKAAPKTWQRFVLVHEVKGRHGMNEGDGKGASITGQVFDGILIPAEDVHPLMFEPVDLDDLSRAEKAKELEKQAIIEEYKRQVKAEEKEARKGDPVECRQWGPSSKLKMQLGICGLQKPANADDGTWNTKARVALKTYLNTLGVNPWDVMFMDGAEFSAAVEDAKKKVMAKVTA